MGLEPRTLDWFCSPRPVDSAPDQLQTKQTGLAETWWESFLLSSSHRSPGVAWQPEPAINGLSPLGSVAVKVPGTFVYTLLPVNEALSLSIPLQWDFLLWPCYWLLGKQRRHARTYVTGNPRDPGAQCHPHPLSWDDKNSSHEWRDPAEWRPSPALSPLLSSYSKENSFLRCPRAGDTK